MATLGERLRGARESRGKTQQELANEIGVSRSSVVKWETDVSEPRRDKIGALSRALGVGEAFFNRVQDDGVKAADGYLQPFTVPHYTWDDIRDIALGRPLRDDIEQMQIFGFSGHINVGRNPENIGRVDVVDNSMSPDFNPGDLLNFDTAVAPWDGCKVICFVQSADLVALRHYRQRAGDSFDVWPENPEYPTFTHSSKQPIVIVGVCIARWQVFQEPGAENINWPTSS